MAYTASEKNIAQKLMIKPGRSVLLVNAPQGYAQQLGELAAGATLLETSSEAVDIIQVFTRNQQELEQHLPPLKALIKPGGMIWVTYYKGSSKHYSDIHRDSINAYAMSLGMVGIAMISIDQDWSALRLKMVEA